MPHMWVSRLLAEDWLALVECRPAFRLCEGASCPGPYALGTSGGHLLLCPWDGSLGVLSGFPPGCRPLLLNQL